MNKPVPGEVNALSYQTRDQGPPTAADLRAILARIGHNRIARLTATGEGYATEAEADLLMALALEGVDAQLAAEQRAAREAEHEDAYPGAGAG